MTLFGYHDVRCSNSVGRGQEGRLTLGGSWYEAAGLYGIVMARSPHRLEHVLTVRERGTQAPGGQP